MSIVDLILFNDFNSEKQREIIGNVMSTVNSTIVFFCKLTGSSNMKFLVGMNTIASKMFLLMYDPIINTRLDECRGTIQQPISVSKEFLKLVNEYNTLLLEYNQYLNIQRYNSEYLSSIPQTNINNIPTTGNTNVRSASVVAGNSSNIETTNNHMENDVSGEGLCVDDGYISSDDDWFGEFDIQNVL